MVVYGNKIKKNFNLLEFFSQFEKAFEDCSVFFDLLDKHGFDNISTVLKKYTEVRVPDAQAICDLAFNNYYEVNIIRLLTLI